MVVHLDTSFLVDAIRESRRGVTGPAREWLTANRSAELALCVPVLCELLVGAELHADPEEEGRRVRQVCAGLPVVHLDERVPAVYARTAATLIGSGDRLATMDLLIASAALSVGAAVLTRNVDHFERVPGLKVIRY